MGANKHRTSAPEHRSEGAVMTRDLRRVRGASVVRGRDVELGLIGDALSATASGHGGVLLVEGPPGIGKTRLLTETGKVARRVGVRVMSGKAWESQQAVPFALLLDAMLESDPALEPAGAARSVGGEGALRYWILHDLRSALEAAAKRSPLAVLLDDLQWADARTLGVLRTLPTRLAGSPILWVLAMRSLDGRAAVRETVASLKRGGEPGLVVGPLSDDAVLAIVTDMLGVPGDRALLDLASHARGNPFLVVELLHGLTEEGRLAREDGRAVLRGDGLPRRLTVTMRERLDGLSTEGQQIVTVASALGPRFTVEQIALMLQCRPSGLVAALTEAQRADLLVEVGDRLGFRHELVREAVLGSLPRSVRQALRREAAGVLLDSGAPVEGAMQLADNAEPGDREAVARLRETAQALANSDAVAAAELSGRALELVGPHDDQRGPLIVEAVRRVHDAMRIAAAQALAESALDGMLSPEQEAEILLILSSVIFRSPLPRSDDNRRALGLAGISPVMRARHLGMLAFNLAFADQLTEASSTAELAIAAAKTADDPQARMMAMLALGVLDRLRHASVTALRRLEDLRALPRRFEPESVRWDLSLDMYYALTLADLGRCDEALNVVTERIAWGHRVHNTGVVDVWTQWERCVRLMAGQLSELHPGADSVEATPEPMVDDVARTIGMVTSAHVALHTGDTRRLRASVQAARAAYESRSSLVRLHAVWVMVLAAIAREDWSDAIRWFYEGEALPYTCPVLLWDPGRQPLIARFALAAGDLGLAQRAVEVAETFDRESPGMPVLAGVAAHVRGLVASDSSDLIDAATRLRGTQRPLLFASASEDAGRILAREGNAERAVAQLTEGLDTYLDLQAVADARRVSRLLRDLGVRRPVPLRPRASSGWGSLTNAELSVARLIAQGATNREAAEQLHLSPHTISTHLRQTFAKLGIHSRTELARRAGQEHPMHSESPGTG